MEDSYHNQLLSNFENISHNEQLRFSNVIRGGEFNVLYLNARNFKAIGRIDALENYVSRLSVSIDVIIITETFLQSNECKYYQLDGYDSFFDCRDRCGGGVALYCKRGLNAEEITLNPMWKGKYFNITGVTFLLNGKVVDLFSIYRPTEYSHDHMRDFFTFLDDFLSAMRVNTFVIGDFNIDVQSNEPRYCSNEFISIVNANAFVVLNDALTRYTNLERTNGSLIDLVLSNSCVFQGQIQTFPLQSMPTLDHEGVLLQLVKEKTSLIDQNRGIKEKRYNYSEFLSLIKEDNYWENISTYEQLALKTSESLETCVIEASTEKRCAEWVTKEYVDLKKLRSSKLLKSRRCQHSRRLLLDDIDALSVKIAALKKQLKEDYVSMNVIKSKNNSKRLWDSINSTLYKGNTKIRRQIMSVNSNGRNLTDPKEIASFFNDFFCSVGDTILGGRRADLNKLKSSHSYKRYVDNVTQIHDFEPVTSDEIQFIITHHIKSGKSPGIDGIPTNILKSLVNSDSFVELCVKVSNDMLETGIFPLQCKEAIVIPLFKKGARTNVENYRPISLLVAFSKILEHVLRRRLLTHLKTNSILHPSQYGFVERSDTTSAIMDLVSNLNEGIDNGKMVAGIFLDLSKAFDLMDHELLFQKFYMYGLRGKALDIFKNYLTDRTQRVKVNGTLSDPLHITRGCPQGSILGPILFILYINDMFNLVLNGTIRCYADDTSYFNEDTDLQSLATNSNSDINRLNEYLEDNLLVVNRSKTQLIIFRSHKRYGESSFENIFKFGDDYLVPQMNVKYLGLILDSFLKWKDHVDYLSMRISPIIGLLYKLKRSLNQEALMTLYYGLINSHLMYMCPIWASGYQTNMNVLNVLQKKAIKNIYGLHRMHPSDDLFASYPIKSIQYLHRYTTLLFIYKNLNGLIHSNISFQRATHEHHTRRRNHLWTERANTNWGRFDVRHNGVRLFNDLPLDTRTAPSIKLFKERVKHHLNNI